MKLGELLEDTIYLYETVKKQGNKYFVYSHRIQGKKLGRKAGYSSLRGAVRAMMIIASRGGFARNPNPAKVINNYISKHNLKG